MTSTPAKSLQIIQKLQGQVVRLFCSGHNPFDNLRGAIIQLAEITALGTQLINFRGHKFPGIPVNDCAGFGDGRMIADIDFTGRVRAFAGVSRIDRQDQALFSPWK